MDELIDASPLLGAPDRMRAQLAEDGYLFFRGLLPVDDVATVRAGVASALTEAGWIADGSSDDRPVPTPAAVREGAEGYLDAYVGIQRLQPFHELAHHASVTALMRDILGEQLLVHPRKIARTSLPQDDEYTPPHQDYRLIQGTVDTLTCWVPLGDCPASLGSLRMLKGSHHRGLIEADAGKGPGGLLVDVADDHADWRTTDYAAGDAILFTSLTVHGALRNNEERLRFSADFRYQSLLEPVLGQSLDPHYFPQVPGWDELTQGWTSRAAVEAPVGVITKEMVDPLGTALQAPPSRLLVLA